MTIVGLVVEGTNDYPVIEAFITKNLNERFARPIQIRKLQPEADATTGAFKGGGWGRVVGWCKANATGAIETYFSPVEEGDRPCDLIVVQIDGDAMANCAQHSTKCPPSEPCSPDDRVSALKAMITEWLQPTQAHSERLRLAVPVMHSEAWLMAALKPDEENWEDKGDAKSPFRALRKGSPKMPMLMFYQIQAITAAKKSSDIIRQSRSFTDFVAELGT